MNLYEITFVRHYVGSDFEPFTTKEKVWQIPASGEWNACAALGLAHVDEDYRIDITRVVKVGQRK